MNDIYGKGLTAYYNGNKKAKFKVESDIAETEYWDVAEFFHNYAEMSEIERRALALCKGKTLDVGAGSGSHTLWLQGESVDVDALDISQGACDLMTTRGIKHVFCDDFFNFANKRYDTLLMLMNGIGIAGTIGNLPKLFAKAKELLNPGGQLIVDSSDLMYLFEDEDGSVMIDLNGDYYGELEYTMSFGGEKGEPFNWLFVDFDTLQAAAAEYGLKCEKVFENEHYQFLAKLTVG